LPASITWIALLMAVLCVPHRSEASASPLAMIRTTVERSMTILTDPAYQGKDNFHQRITKLEQILLPQIDSWEFGRRCLGVHWQQLTDDQRRQFIDLFKDLIEKSYGGMLDRYTTGVRFSYDGERIDGDFAEVDTRVFTPAREQPFTLSYRLHQKDGQWLIYDVVAENVSMVRNYRTQFDHILSKSSFAELAQTLERKIKQLETAPTL
jgi:phospholipid transport system substrate-binding protein